MTRVLVIANPAAGGVNGELVWRVVRRCGHPSVHWTAAPADATGIARAAADSVDLVVSVGGDGTAREVAAGIATAWRHTAMALVPAGTANSLYRTLWVDTPWPVALDLALGGHPPTRLDMARLAGHGQLVFAGASAGFPPQAIHRAKATGVGYGESLAALAPAYRPYPGRVTVDGQIVHSGPTLLVNVGGSRFRGGNFELLPRSVLDDGRLDVCVIGGEHRAVDMLRLTRTGAHVGRPGVVYARGRRVDVERLDDRPLWFEHDGEVLDLPRSSYHLSVLPGAVGVVSALVDSRLAVVDTRDAA